MRSSLILLPLANLKCRRCYVMNIVEVQSTCSLSRFVVCLASQWVTLLCIETSKFIDVVLWKHLFLDSTVLRYQCRIYTVIAKRLVPEYVCNN
jgi:hypothetical protein